MTIKNYIYKRNDTIPKMKGIRIFILVLFLSIFSISTVLAGDFVFSRHDTVNVKIPCTFSGTSCAPSASCNLSLQYPNSTFMLNKVTPNNLGNGYLNYTISFPDNGIYAGRIDCTQNGLYGSSELIFIVTPNGKVPTLADSTFYIILFLIGLVLFSISFYQMFSAEDNHKGVIWSCPTYIFAWLISFVLWQITSNYLYEVPALSPITLILFIIFTAGFLPFLFAIGLWLLKGLGDKKEIEKLVAMGWQPQEAEKFKRR